jgi:kumamolisin
MAVAGDQDHVAPTGIHPYLHFPRRSPHHPYIKILDPKTAENQPDAKPWDIPALCAAYGWPSSLAGGGVIAIVELGGGWVQSDLNLFFTAIGQPQPSITDVSVDGTKNTPGFDQTADGEVALDVQVAAAAYYVATGKPATIRVYWSKDMVQAVRAATADHCDVCSISWGSDEARWGRIAGQDMEQAATDATKAGMIVLAASGDNDSSDGGPNPANVDLPASCPHIIGCGGTRKTSTAETVWNNNPGNPSGEGTGGGFSTLFPLPTWQIGAPNGPGRMVPDVSANADPVTGYNIALRGAITPIGGTSAVAPLYAGLFAAFGNKLGWITPELYLNQVCFNDITQGDNGAYRAAPGPDPCSGIGSPIASKLAALLTTSVAAHNRQLNAMMAENAQLREALAATQHGT